MSGSGEEPIRLGSFEFRPAHRSLRGDKAEVGLSPLATRFLACLVAARGGVVTRDELIDELWDGNFLVGDPALNRLTSETRRAAVAAGSGTLIETVQKRGYRIADPGAARQPSSPPARRRWPIWAGVILGFLLVAGTLHWLMDTATGLIWLAQQGAN